MQQVQGSADNKESTWPHILIMEDELSVAKGLGMVLSEEGYSVDLAMTGRSALDNVNSKIFDLLVADLRLPDIDGMEVIKQVKQRQPDTEVLVITGYSTVNTAVEAMKLGASDYLSKPFTEDEFISAVKVALDKKGVTITDSAPLPEAGMDVAPPLEPSPEDLQCLSQVMEQIRHEFSGQRDNLIAILQRVQNTLSYIPMTALSQIADFTNIPEASVFGVATFYERFRLHPVGRHIVKVCRGTACHVKGAERIINGIEDQYHILPGQTSKDRMFTLETVACFGSCAIAPVVVVDDKVKGRMNSAKVGQVMEDVTQKDIKSDLQ